SSCPSGSERDSRVQPGVEHVDQERACHVRECRNENDRLDDWIIAAGDTIDGQPSDSGPEEYGFRNESALDDRANLKTDDRHDWNQRGPQRVANDDGPLG